jgi:hypothetical protein
MYVSVYSSVLTFNQANLANTLISKSVVNCYKLATKFNLHVGLIARPAHLAHVITFTTLATLATLADQKSLLRFDLQVLQGVD